MAHYARENPQICHDVKRRTSRWIVVICGAAEAGGLDCTIPRRPDMPGAKLGQDMPS
jgi:hypothetical protein